MHRQGSIQDDKFRGGGGGRRGRLSITVVSVPDRSALFFIIWTGGADRSGTKTSITVLAGHMRHDCSKF